MPIMPYRNVIILNPIRASIAITEMPIKWINCLRIMANIMLEYASNANSPLANMSNVNSSLYEEISILNIKDNRLQPKVFAKRIQHIVNAVMNRI